MEAERLRVLGDRASLLKAITKYDESLPMKRTAGDQSGEATSLNSIAGIYYLLGEKQTALEYFNQAFQIFRAAGNRVGEASTLNRIGTVYDSIGEKRKALDYFYQSLPIRRAAGDRVGEVTTLNNIGSLYEISGKKKKALNCYQQSIARIESLRTSATIEEIKTGLSEQRVSTYQNAIPLLVQLGRRVQTFDLSERARARTFLDQIGSVYWRWLGTTKLIQEEQPLALEVNTLEQRLRQERSKPVASLNTDVISSLTNQIAAKRRQYEDLLLRIKLTNPEYSSLRSVDTLRLPQIQKLLRKEITLLSYRVTPNKTLAFVVTRNSFRVAEIQLKESDLAAAATWFRGFAALRGAHPESLKQLYNWLIVPVKKYIKTPVVGVIPYGVLHYLPFAALTDGQRYFGDEHTIFYLPSASVLPFIQKKSKPVGTKILAMAQSQDEGSSRLQYADDEVQTVAELFSAKAFTAGDSSKSEFLKRAGDYSILHIAAHAALNTANPLFSKIMFGRGKDDTGALG